MRVIPPLRQRDGRTCGPSVAVVAGALLDSGYRRTQSGADADAGQDWFAAEQLRVHALVNRVWPRALGTTPRGMARALNLHSLDRGLRYRWRPWRGKRDRLTDVLAAVCSHRPVPMLVGRWIPRHWVLIVDTSALNQDEPALRCYEPSSGEVRTVGINAVRRAQLSGLGFPRCFAFVVPRSDTPSPGVGSVALRRQRFAAGGPAPQPTGFGAHGWLPAGSRHPEQDGHRRLW